MGFTPNKVIIESEPDNKNEYYLKRIVDLLQFNRLYNSENKINLNKIQQFAKENLIDFGLLERGMVKLLKLIGNRVYRTLPIELRRKPLIRTLSSTLLKLV